MPEETPQVEEQKKGGLIAKFQPILIPLVVSLVVTIVVSFVFLTMMGGNKTPAQTKEEDAKTAIPIKAVVIQTGTMTTFMLKGGRDVVVIDSLTLLVGTDRARSLCGEKQDEIMDALSVIFLSKERTDLVTPAGVDLLKKQIRQAVNEIIGFTGEAEKDGVLNVYLYIKAISSVQ